MKSCNICSSETWAVTAEAERKLEREDNWETYKTYNKTERIRLICNMTLIAVCDWGSCSVEQHEKKHEKN